MTDRRVDSQQEKLFGRGVIKLRIAVISALILVIGAWLAPRASQPALPTSEERAAPLLEEQVQLRERNRAFVGVQEVAAGVRQYSVEIPAPPAPPAAGRNDFSDSGTQTSGVSGLGVFVSDTYVLAHNLALDGRSSVELTPTPGEPPVSARVVAYEPSTGLVLLETPPVKRTAPTFAAESPPAGALAVGVGRAGDEDIAMPVFVTRAGSNRYTLGGADAVLPGMPVFTIAGELFAVAAPDGPAIRALPVKAAADRLMARAATGERRASFGIAFQDVSDALTPAFGSGGVVLTEVIEGGPADLADLQVGDVLIGVGDEQIQSAESAASVLNRAAIGAPIRLQTRRGGRIREAEIAPVLAFEIAALARARPDVQPGLEARAILPASVLAASAIPPTARVLSVNGRGVTSRAQVQRELRAARTAVPVLIRQGGNPYFVALETAR
jgi:S1-C subfamily serine protease